MRRQPEKAAQAAIVKLLRMLGASVYVIGRNPPRDGRQHFGTGQTSGLADLVAFMPSRMPFGCGTQVWIEVKASKGRLSEAQKAFQACCDACGQAHVVGGIDVVTAYLERGGWLKASPREARR